MRRCSTQVRLVLGTALLCFGSGTASAAEPPVTVSPGSSTGALIADVCPTFSWGAVPGADHYELAVYRLDQEGEQAPLVLEQDVPGSALGWTPSLDRCMARGGEYGWSIRSVDGSEVSEWSPPSLFQVRSGPSVAEFEAALQLVRQYLETHAGVEVDRIAGVGVEMELQSERESPASLPAAKDGVAILLSVAGGLSAAELCDESGGNCRDLSAGSGIGDGHSLDSADGLQTNVLSVDNGGNIGIGGASPGGKLVITGNAVQDALRVRASDGGAGVNDLMVVAADGNVGIGTMTPDAKLEVVGDIKLGGNLISDSDICIGTCP